LRIVARARRLGAGAKRLPGGSEHRDRRHLPLERAQERGPSRGRPRRGAREAGGGAGTEATFAIDPFAKYCLINGVDELGFLLQQADSVASFEQAMESGSGELE